MIRQNWCLVALAGWLVTVAIGRAEAVDPFNEEPFATFIGHLNAFSAQPTVAALDNLKTACARLPVRDLKPGQIGDGHPLDRETKLRCMLRFVAAMDKLTQDHLPTAYINVGVPGVMAAGMNPGDVVDPAVRARYIAAIAANNAAIRIWNFQVSLQQVRDVMVRSRIPGYMEYDCRKISSARLQQIIAEELQSDRRAEKAIDSLSKAAAGH